MSICLGPRLQGVADISHKSGTIADIGTDHGMLPLWLLTHGKCKEAIAVDISEPSLKKARDLSIKLGINTLQTRLGDGLSVLLPGEAQTVYICGMGGSLICNMLSRGEDIAKKSVLVMQPMRNVPELRRFLAKGYRILDEDLVVERGRYYHIIMAKAGIERCTESKDFEIGRRLIEKRHPLLLTYLAQKTAKLKQIVNGLPNGVRKTGLLRLIREYEEVLACL